ncbi:hypothetical protein D3C73_1313150 [compost metagenome]
MNLAVGEGDCCFWRENRASVFTAGNAYGCGIREIVDDIIAADSVWQSESLVEINGCATDIKD